MTLQTKALLILCALSCIPQFASSAGFRTASATDGDSKPLRVGIWYPSEDAITTKPHPRYGLDVAIDAPIANANGSVIVLSHGYSGWYAGHADTAIALADAGFIVAAPSHTGNTFTDMSSSPDQWVLDRPRHISRVIDYLLTDTDFEPHVNDQKIGVYGFSAGGLTAMNLIGAVPDIEKANQHCVDDPSEFVCAEGLVGALDAAGVNELPKNAWGADRRISAAVIAAPALGFAFSEQQLMDVKADVQLWSADLDFSVPTNTNAAHIANNLPTQPEIHWIDNATHYSFLIVPCREAFKNEDPVQYETVCSDNQGFNRRAFHDAMHTQMIRFFSESFGLR